MNRFFMSALQGLIVMVLPVLFLTGSIRALLATDTLLRVEYSRPDFSPDGYRFVPDGALWSVDERLRYGIATLMWLRDGRPLAELAAIKQDNGLPLYKQSELGHMDDVQNLTNRISQLLVLGALGAGLGGAALAWQKETRRALPATLTRAGVLTWLIAGAITVMLLGGIGSTLWDTLFTGFHQVFFPQGNWQFAYSDSLIRLFPEQLWFDVALLMLGTPLVLAALSGALGSAWRRKLA